MSAEGLTSQWLAKHAQTHPDVAALVSDQLSLTYVELYEHTARLAAAVVGRGLPPTTPFAVISAKALPVALSLYLALHTGRPVLPLSPRRPDLYPLLAECAIRYAFIDTCAQLAYPVQVLPAAWLEQSWDTTLAKPSDVPNEAIQLVVPTTGTTTFPRAVMLSAANLAAAVQGSRRRLGLCAGDAWLDCMPLSHVAGLSVLLRCLESGTTVVLHEGFSPSHVWSDLFRHQISHISLVPAMLHALLDHSGGQRPPAGLRVALVGGASLPDALLRRARESGWPVCPTYGLSEASSQVATHCPSAGDLQAGDVGQPLPGVSVEILDPDGKPTRGSGTIRVSGPTIMVGYSNPDWSPGIGLSAGGFTTSDLGHIDARGHLHMLGRTDNLIVSGAENVSPEQVEALIGAHPNVREIGITAVPDAIWGERVFALFSGDLDETVLAAWCKTHLPSALRPRGFLKLDALPRNALGKLDRDRLRRRAAEVKPE